MNAVQTENSTNSLLTPRQTRILNLIAKGYNSEDISRMLKVNRNTVHGHLKLIRRKTGITSNTLLGFYALGKGIVTQEEIHTAMRRQQRSKETAL